MEARQSRLQSGRGRSARTCRRVRERRGPSRPRRVLKLAVDHLFDLAASLEAIRDSVRTKPVRIGAVLDREDGSYNLTVQGGVLLGRRDHDAERVSGLLKRVAEHADFLEQIHLPDADRALDVFADDLRQEGLGYRN